jgi:Holliday junction resolvase RusA-like endonuclease
LISFTVYGKPEPQGSTRAFVPKGWKRPIITSANKKLKPWRQQITAAAMAHMREEREEPYSRETPILIELDFFLQRPATLPKRILLPAKRPDVDKLCRGIFDSLSGVIFTDDCQIVSLIARKFYGAPERVEIKIQAEGEFMRGKP